MVVLRRVEEESRKRNPTGSIVMSPDVAMIGVVTEAKVLVGAARTRIPGEA